MNKKIEDALNEQINAELYSGYLYLSMASYLESIDLSGAATWMKIQYGEENEHAMKFFDYIAERGGRVKLDVIQKPKADWDSVLNVFENAYAHEKKISAMINDLVDLAIAEKDHALNNFLQWYVAEQMEEERNTSEIVRDLKMVGDSKNGLFMLDKELGSRKAE